MVIHAEEKKANHGQNSVTFKPRIMSGTPESDIIFFIISKEKAQKKFLPVYKSECLNGSSNMIFNVVSLDTHTLANDNDMAPVLFQIFKW